MAIVLRPSYLVDGLGEYAILPDGAIINIGGVIGPGFTVGGKPLLFADGTPTDGTIGVPTVPVLTDRIAINASAGNYIPFIMDPQPGVIPAVNVVDIKIVHAGPSVFTIDKDGVVHIPTLDIGTINGVNLPAILAQLQAHLDLASLSIKHTADQISFNSSGLSPITGTNVQQAIASIALALQNNTGPVSEVRGYEHIQSLASKTWVVPHNQNTRRVQVTVWDSNDEEIWVDSIRLTNENTVTILFSLPITGRAILMLF